jgi:hypothetical protein
MNILFEGYEAGYCAPNVTHNNNDKSMSQIDIAN